MPTYQPNIPTGNVPLNEDYLNVQGNFQQLNIAYGQDHVPLTDTSGLVPGGISGCHTLIHQTVQSVSPPVIAGMTQLYSKNYTPDTVGGGTLGTQLFMTNSGGEIQLTGTAQLYEGWAWFNGLLVQWGKVVSNASSGTVTFKTRGAATIPFPNNCFNVQCTPTVSSTTSHVSTIYTSTITSTKFDWIQADRATSQTGFNWMAIGN